MHKVFYASGFLFHPASERILLQQQNPDDTTSKWTLLGSQNEGSESSEDNFRRVVKQLLNINLPKTAIRAVYNYHHPVLKKEHYVLYALLTKMVEFPLTKKAKFSWFTLKEISKLPISAETKQDIIVGQRVINAQVRKGLGELNRE